jgi:plastocyanin domain-containing protein
MNIEFLYWFLNIMFLISLILLPLAIFEIFYKEKKTEIELWTEEYQKDVPIVWK